MSSIKLKALQSNLGVYVSVSFHVAIYCIMFLKNINAWQQWAQSDYSIL